MAAKKKKAQKKSSSTSKSSFNISSMKPKNGRVRAVVYALIALFLILGALGIAGPIGTFVHERIVIDLMGYGFILAPAVLIYGAVLSFKRRETKTRVKVALFVLVLAILGLMHILFSYESNLVGGAFGRLVAEPLVRGFEQWFSGILLFGAALIGGFIAFDPNFSSLKKAKEKITDIREKRREEKEKEQDFDEQVEEAIANGTPDEQLVSDTPREQSPSDVKKESPKKKEEEEMSMDGTRVFASDYQTPPLSLLGKSSGKAGTGDIKTNANLIQRTLANFGIAVEMDEISVGPTVTRYAMKPAQGVRLSRIASLQNELALALAAKSIRIEAPIPGRSLVGIEVPNTSKSTIGLGSLLADKQFVNSPKPLLISLGKGVSGKSYYANLGKMPHALIAGATGSGKSVTVHNIVLSLLYRNGPDMLRFIMVDPKRVEMTLYKKIPHLLTPVITDPKKAVLALKWAVKEMERRYDVLQKNAVRDIDSYHKTIVAPAYKKLSPEQIEERSGELPERMPYIVVIIDELSDIMSAYPRELEASIVRLAQMSRAVGIHLLLSTQRPSVNVITGLIKANVPTRIALKVASQIDSRTILDSQGAEKLLGQGDMLYKGPEFNEPVRVQCPFVSEEEVKEVVDFIRNNYRFELEDEISLPDENLDGGGGVSLSDDEDEDPLYEDARITVIENKKASTSFLQRKLSIGYSRAARIMDMLEDKGVIGPQNGSKAREVFEMITEAADEGEDYEEETEESQDYEY
jgi:S-DNA-T family DNA segregation ATPase FtsK/SpoIIIE